MAGYDELHELHSDSDLLARISTAISVAVLEISAEDGATPNNVNRLHKSKGQQMKLSRQIWIL